MPAHKAATCSCSSLRRGIAAAEKVSQSQVVAPLFAEVFDEVGMGDAPGARQRYEDAKLRFVNKVGDDRTTYTEGKTEIVASLLDEA